MYLNIAKDFTNRPGPRYIWQGEKSGEEFYIKHLLPSFLECKRSLTTLFINLDNTEGYATSFLEESFGKLVFSFGKEQVLKTCSFIMDDKNLLKYEIDDIIDTYNLLLERIKLMDVYVLLNLEAHDPSDIIEGLYYSEEDARKQNDIYTIIKTKINPPSNYLYEQTKTT